MKLMCAIEARRDEIHGILKVINGSKGKKIPGRLRIAGTDEKPQYYWRKIPSDRQGQYLKKSEVSTAQKLAQQDYDEKYSKALKREDELLASVEKFMKSESVEVVEREYNPARKKLVDLRNKGDMERAMKWQEAEYIRKSITTCPYPLFLSNGIQVRSKSEVMIGETLIRLGIPFRYEERVMLDGGKIAVHPDFTVMNVRTGEVFYWEHMGMMDSEEYVNKNLPKLRQYEKDGIFPGRKLILTFESGQCPLDVKEIERVIKEYLV